MVPLFFNIYLNDIFYFVNKCDITNYADDTTPYAVGTTMDTLLNSLEKDTKILIKWFRDNYFQPNADKRHLLISHHSKDILINVEDEIIECSSSVKPLGVTIDNKLNFDEHVSKLCKKARGSVTPLLVGSVTPLLVGTVTPLLVGTVTPLLVGTVTPLLVGTVTPLLVGTVTPLLV